MLTEQSHLCLALCLFVILAACAIGGAIVASALRYRAAAKAALARARAVQRDAEERAMWLLKAAMRAWIRSRGR